jgi:hypothetical protein
MMELGRAGVAIASHHGRPLATVIWIPANRKTLRSVAIGSTDDDGGPSLA